MNTFLIYILESTICISVFYLLFRLLMRKETSFAVNRATLLTIVVASVIVPLVQLPQLMQTPVHVELIPEFSENKIQIQNLPVAENATISEVQPFVTESTPATSEFTISLETLLRYFYMTGVLVALLLFIRNIILIFLLSRKAIVRQMDGYRLLIVDREVPSFAFGRSVVISQTDYDLHGLAILAHEQAHIRQNHFYDLMLLELVRTIHWFNPAVYALIGDMKEIHEFQADDQTLHSGIDAKQYQLLIIQKGVGPRRFALANSFNHCQIKKRITMMNKSKTSKAWCWKVATFLPLLALLLMAFGNRSETLIKKEIQNETVNVLQADLKEDNRTIDNGVISVPSELNLVLNDQTKEETAVSEVKQETQKVIKGKVIDEYGNALEGVSVVGSKRMKTTTDVNGNFEIAMTEDLPLWFSHAGLRRTARTPPELEESTIVKMEADISNFGVTITMFTKEKTSTGIKSSSANEAIETDDNKNNKIFIVVDQMPEFPDGTDALRQFIAKQTKYPKIAMEDKANGQVVVNFVINREGQVWYAKVVKSVHPALDQEAIRVIYSLPRWKPGIHHGKTVNVAYTIPINFSYQLTQN